jgi:hypothetical protein
MVRQQRRWPWRQTTTQSVSNPEVDLWDANRKAGLFESAFDRETEIVRSSRDPE